MSQQDHLRLTREELYSVVWSKPMTEVGQDFHVSDRAMAKLCARMQVPVPPRGYWAKKAAGKTILKPPLAMFVEKPRKESKVKPRPAERVSEKQRQPSAIDERSQRIKKAVKEFRRPLSEAVEYSVRIDGWCCDYSFGLNASYEVVPDVWTGFSGF